MWTKDNLFLPQQSTHKLASDKLEKINSWQEWYITSSLAFSSSVFVCLLLCNNDFFLNEAISYVFCLVFFFWKFFWMICFLDLIFLDDASAQQFLLLFSKTLFVTVTYIVGAEVLRIIILFFLWLRNAKNNPRRKSDSS